MAVAVGFLTYTRVSFKFAPQVKRQMEFKEFRHKKNQFAVKGLQWPDRWFSPRKKQ